VENLAARSETAQVFANPDGSRTMQLSATPQRVHRADGSWVGADPTLRRNADGTWSAVAATVDVRFSGGGGGAMVTVVRGGRTATVAWPGDLPPPAVVGDTATYPDVLAGVDLVLRATVDGFSHVLVVKNAKPAADPALRRIGYQLGGSKVRFAPAAPEGVEVTGDDGTPRAAGDRGTEREPPTTFCRAGDGRSGLVYRAASPRGGCLHLVGRDDPPLAPGEWSFHCLR